MSSTKMIEIRPGVDIQLTYPDEIPTQVLSKMIPFIVRTAAEVISRSGAGIVTAAVETYEVTSAKVVFYKEYGRVLREEVIPIVAKAKAYQDGRDWIDKLGLDDDIRSDAQRDLDKKRRQ